MREHALSKPAVKLPRNDWMQWLLAIGLAGGVLWVLSALLSGQRAEQPSILAPTDTVRTISAPPPLVLPDEGPSQEASELVFLPEIRPSPPNISPAPPPAPPPRRPDRPPTAQYTPPPQRDRNPPPRQREQSSTARQTPASDPPGALVIDQGVLRVSAADSQRINPANGGRALDPLRPLLANFSPTLIRAGTLIPAVLETALDSSRNGVARAMVTADVRGFDGSEVLIERGSRLIGQYGTDAAPGQKRMLVTWNRLVLPDGRQVIIDFPAVDQGGATGIEGRVHSNFLGRFGNALFQTALDIATLRIANRASDGSVVIAPTGAVANATQGLLPEQNFQRRITVKAGERVTVFVSQDIEFSPDRGPQR